MFVNRRPVDSRTLNYALIESYATSLMKGRYPVAVLFLGMDPAAVDVNVHPAKREVRFRSEGAVRGFVIRAVLQRLREMGAPSFAKATEGGPALPPAEHLPGDPVTPPVPEGKAASPFAAAARTESAPYPVPSVMSQPFRHFAALPVRPAAAVPRGTDGPASSGAAVAAPLQTPRSALPASPLTGWRFLGTAHADFALFEAPGGLVVLDRRAAQERVWFERLTKQFNAGQVASQRLLFAVPLELDAIASALLTDQLAFLQQHGLEVGEFGRNFFRIEAVPVWLEPADAETFVRDVIGLIREGRLDGKKADLAREELARLAAQKAVRLPATLTEAEALALVGQLFACAQPHTSPAGRPTHFELSRGELARRFQR
jgi:DNA mismatch repair protein MutL